MSFLVCCLAMLIARCKGVAAQHFHLCTLCESSRCMQCWCAVQKSTVPCCRVSLPPSHPLHGRPLYTKQFSQFSFIVYPGVPPLLTRGCIFNKQQCKAFSCFLLKTVRGCQSGVCVPQRTCEGNVWGSRQFSKYSDIQEVMPALSV